GAWWSYIFQRVEGLSLTGEDITNQPNVKSSPGNVQLTGFPHRRDRTLFSEAYADPDSGISTGRTATPFPATTSAIKYICYDAIDDDVIYSRQVLGGAGNVAGFITFL